MNNVTLEYLDKSNRQGILFVNSKRIPVHFVQSYKDNEDFNGKLNFSCQVANDWNISNPITFTAPTIKGLIGQLKRHKYNLVKY